MQYIIVNFGSLQPLNQVCIFEYLMPNYTAYRGYCVQKTKFKTNYIRGNFSVIKALLQKGADVDAQDSDGNTPCHFCSEYGHSDCLELLLHMKHPQLVTKNKDNVSPLDVAVNKEILQVGIRFILQF